MAASTYESTILQLKKQLSLCTRSSFVTPQKIELCVVLVVSLPQSP